MYIHVYMYTCLFQPLSPYARGHPNPPVSNMLSRNEPFGAILFCNSSNHRDGNSSSNRNSNSNRNNSNRNHNRNSSNSSGSFSNIRRFGSVGSENYISQCDAVRPAFFGRVVARSGLVRFVSASGPGRFHNSMVGLGSVRSVRFGFLFLPDVLIRQL